MLRLHFRRAQAQPVEHGFLVRLGPARVLLDPAPGVFIDPQVVADPVPVLLVCPLLPDVSRLSGFRLERFLALPALRRRLVLCVLVHGFCPVAPVDREHKPAAENVHLRGPARGAGGPSVLTASAPRGVQDHLAKLRLSGGALVRNLGQALGQASGVRCRHFGRVLARVRGHRGPRPARHAHRSSRVLVRVRAPRQTRRVSTPAGQRTEVEICQPQLVLADWTPEHLHATRVRPVRFFTRAHEAPLAPSGLIVAPISFRRFWWAECLRPLGSPMQTGPHRIFIRS